VHQNVQHVILTKIFIIFWKREIFYDNLIANAFRASPTLDLSPQTKNPSSVSIGMPLPVRNSGYAIARWLWATPLLGGFELRHC